MFELLLALLQVLGVILAGGFGLLGLLTKYRDEAGRITRWGRVALVGVVVSTLVAVSAQALEAVRKSRESKASAQRTERIIAEVMRAVHPLTDIELTSWILLPWDHAEVRGYRARVEPQLRRIDAEWDGNAFKQPRSCGRLSCFAGNQQSHAITAKTVAEFSTKVISFGSKSPLFPRETSESPPRHLTRTQIHIAIYKDHIDPTHFMAMWSGSSDPVDLRFSVRSDDPKLTYELAHQKMILYLTGKARPRPEMSKGTIVAIPDLAGTQMIVSLVPGSMSQRELEALPRVSEVRYALELRSVLMRFGDRAIVLASGDDTVGFHTSADGFPLWSYVFPSKLEELGTPRRAKSK